MLVAIALAVWFGTLGVMFWNITQYEFRTDATHDHATPLVWPEESPIAVVPNRATLLVFLHSKCPCSAATVTELEQLFDDLRMCAMDPLPLVQIVAVVPQHADRSWLESAVIRRALHLPSAQLVIDEEGREARRFGAEISGTVVYFDHRHHLQYCGGVTGARGHVGNNTGRSSLFQIIARRRSALPDMRPALGCQLIQTDCEN